MFQKDLITIQICRNCKAINTQMGNYRYQKAPALLVQRGKKNCHIESSKRVFKCSLYNAIFSKVLIRLSKAFKEAEFSCC